MKAGIVIASYGMPSAVSIQVKICKRENVPILIVDDCSGCQEQLRSDVDLIVNKVRLGHALGFLSGLRSGMMWGRENLLDVICIISQRLWITEEAGWLERLMLGELGGDVLAGIGYDVRGKYDFIKTEFMLVKTGVILPPYHLKKLGRAMPAERWLYKFWCTKGVKIPLLASLPKHLCYRLHSLQDYLWYAQREFGEKLGADFHVNYFRNLPDYDCG